MKTLTEIEAAILAVIEKLKTNSDYYLSEENEKDEAEILDALKVTHSYDWEEDNDAFDYFLKATPEEIWEYYSETIIPKLKAASNV